MSVSEEIVQLLCKEPIVREFNLTTDIVTRTYYSKSGSSTGVCTRHYIENRFLIHTYLSDDVLVKIVHSFGREVCDLNVYIATACVDDDIEEQDMELILSHYNIPFKSTSIMNDVMDSITIHYNCLERHGKDNLNRITDIREGRIK